MGNTRKEKKKESICNQISYKSVEHKNSSYKECIGGLIGGLTKDYAAVTSQIDHAKTRLPTAMYRHADHGINIECIRSRINIDYIRYYIYILDIRTAAAGGEKKTLWSYLIIRTTTCI